MIFDSRATFEPGTGRAILWADTPIGARFQVVIGPQYAVDLWGLRRPVEPSRFAAAIQEHMDEITKAAVAAYANGELVLQLD
jgi:hypothetical protein